MTLPNFREINFLNDFHKGLRGKADKVGVLKKTGNGGVQNKGAVRKQWEGV